MTQGGCFGRRVFCCSDQMKQRLRRLAAAVLALWSVSLTAVGSITSTGDVDPPDPSTWVSGSSGTAGIVGKTGEGMLTINDNSDVSSRHGLIGTGADSAGHVAVDGVGSTWRASDRIYVGSLGDGTLAITGGGVVSTPSGYIGMFSGSTGEVTVDGQGSAWKSSFLAIGNSGSGTLSITRGGSVVSRSGAIGSNLDSWGQVAVDGVGSTWSQFSGLSVGSYGNGLLSITGGAAVNSGISVVGRSASSTGQASVDGLGSIWSIAKELYVGRQGAGSLRITGDGTVSVVTDTYVGAETGSSGKIHFAGGTLLTGSLFASTEDLTGTGTVKTKGLVSDVDLVFDATHPRSQTLVLSASPEKRITLQFNTNSSQPLGVGYRGAGTMSIADGVSVASGDGYVGYHSGSTGQVTVSGEGSTWNSDGYLHVGLFGVGTLSITEKGAVQSKSISYLGYYSGSMGQATVNGVGSNWTSSRSLLVGVSGEGTLSIANGGVVHNDSGYLGYEPGSSGKVAVNGAGSTWTNYNLIVGRYGSGELSVTHGGTVSNRSGNIGAESGSTGKVEIDGSGSTWIHGGDLYIGKNGEGTALILNGGAVRNDHGYIGYGVGSTGQVIVDGDDSVWTNAGDLYVGRGGHGTLTITAGGAVSVSENLFVAPYAGSSGEIRLAQGFLTTGGMLGAAKDLAGSGTIYTRGLVSDVDLVFDSTHGLNQTITLDDLPEQNVTIHVNFSADRDLGVGYGSAGSMLVTDGIAIESMYGYVGYHPGAEATVSVEGSGSTWGNSNGLYVGRGGRGTLVITGGGAVRNTNGDVGYRSNSTGFVRVDGAQSSWTNEGALFIGNFGDGTLSITGGAAVSSFQGHIGYSADSTGRVLIDGEGSTWNNSGDLYVGQSYFALSRLTKGEGVALDGFAGSDLLSNAQGAAAVAPSIVAAVGDLTEVKNSQGSLSITGGAIVTVGGTLTIDRYSNGDSFIHMATGGKLALAGEVDDSIVEFLGIVGGAKSIRYWDISSNDWTDISQATAGVDFTLQYLVAGDLAGYTLLTVGAIPEPPTAILSAVAMLCAMMHKCRFCRRPQPSARKTSRKRD